MSIILATSQFATTADPAANASAMVRQMDDARAAGADLVHFPEACLSGYAGADLPDYQGYDWAGLRRSALIVADAAASYGLWVVFGSAHRFAANHKPHNSLYIVDPRGRLVDRYDKRFCAGRDDPPTSDLAHFTPGSRFCQFEVKGARFGLLICHEYRYPELYREHGRRGTQIVLHAFHAAALSETRYAEMEAAVGHERHHLNPATTIAGITQLAFAHGAASSNGVWISCANSAAPRSCWGSFVVRPDGVCTGRLDAEQDGLVLTMIDPGERFYDSTALWRERACRGVFYSGTLIDHPADTDRWTF